MVAILREMAKHVAEFEGFIDHIYLDTVGVPTTAFGYNLSFPETKAKVGEVAGWQLADIERDIEACHAYAQQVGHLNILASGYANHTQLRLSKAHGVLIMEHALEKFVEKLKMQGFEIGAYPAPAAMALIDMAYNLGVAGLTRKFPNFCKAIKRHDWRAAAKESKRRGISDARNKATADLLMDAVV